MYRIAKYKFVLDLFWRRVLLLSALAFLIGLTPSAAHAAPWDGTIATSFAGGSGTESDPYLISTAEQLAYLADLVNANNDNADYYKLTADIDLDNREWTPIGKTNPASYFSGSFDGDGHVVSNMKITISTDNFYVGLFGCTDGDGMTIKNVGVTNFSITSNSRRVGPLVGSLSRTNVVDCYARDGSISITGNVTVERRIGGLIGHASTGSLGGAEISASYADCSISYASTSSTIVADVGGLVGFGNTNITGCYATGSISVSNSTTCSVGGLVGKYRRPQVVGAPAIVITDSYASVSVSAKINSGGDASSYAQAGGLVGTLIDEQRIANSYATGSVEAVNAAYPANAFAGGLVGLMYHAASKPAASLETSYTWSALTVDKAAGAKMGGLVGCFGDSSTSSPGGDIRSCDWRGDADVNAGLDDAIGTGAFTIDPVHLTKLNAAQFKLPANFVAQGWDFDTVWCYALSDSGARPRLRSFVDAADIMRISDKDILEVSLTVDGTRYDAALQEDGRTWLINLPEGTDLSPLSPAIRISEKASLSPQGPYDFSQNTVGVTVTAFDGTEKKYALMITAKGSDPTEDLKGRISEFVVRNIPFAPVDGDTSFDIYIEWKARTDTETDEWRPPDEWPIPKPTATWSITPPTDGGTWAVSVDADPENFFRARLVVDTKGNPLPANRERYYVSVHMQQAVEGQTVFDETYQRGFYIGEKFLTTVTLSPEAQAEIDRVNAILAQTDVEIVPGNHQARIPQHLIDAIIDHLKNNLVTYGDASERAATIAAGTGADVSAARSEIVAAFFARQAERRASGEEARVASGDIEIYILDDIETIRMATRSPEPEAVPDCFDCVDKMSANIVLDLTLLSDDVQSEVIMLPMSYTVTIRSNDMAELYAGYPIDAMVANPENYLDEIFEILVLHKRIHEGDMLDWYTRLIRGVAQPYEAYDTGMLLVWGDVDEGSIALSLGYYVINYHGESFIVSDDSVGYIILPDGDRNDTLIDPLWLNKWSTDTNGGGGGGGCTTGTAALATITAFCAISLGRRSRRRNRRD